MLAGPVNNRYTTNITIVFRLLEVIPLIPRSIYLLSLSNTRRRLRVVSLITY